MAAVRSFLHFSQLSAWLSVSGGRRPPNVLYRLTVTSPVFCSKFTAEAEEHVFPITYMGQDTSIKVRAPHQCLMFLLSEWNDPTWRTGFLFMEEYVFVWGAVLICIYIPLKIITVRIRD